MDDNSSVRLGKSRLSIFPPEVVLSRFVEHVHPKSPTWRSENIPQLWNSVRCKGKHVVALEWGSQKLKGNLSWEHLPQTLEFLSLNNNMLHGPVPLYALPSGLSHVHLQRNRFSGTLDFTALPHNLVYLQLQKNLFHGTLDVSSLPHRIQQINVARNMLEGYVDIRELPETLVYLDLSRNNLIPFPEHISCRVVVADESNEPIHHMALLAVGVIVSLSIILA